jgi:PAS domain S-box-containing protein
VNGRRFWLCLAFATVYAVVARLGLTLAVVHPSATAVWPPTGIALAALLVLGRSLWPGVLAGAFLANVTTAGSAATSLGIAIGNTLEAVLGCYLVARFAHGRHAFDHPQDVLRYAGLAGLVGTAVSATIGVTSLAVGGYAEWAQYGSIWTTWWLGDAGGALVVGPFLLLWSQAPTVRWTRRTAIEVLLALLLVLVTGGVVFRGWLPFAFLCLPVVTWVAFRLGRRAAATAVVGLSAIAVWGTTSDLGPFARESPATALLWLQVFMGSSAVVALVLAAAVVELRNAVRGRFEEAAARSHAQEALRAETKFRALLESGPDAVVVDASGRIVLVNSRAERMFGYPRSELIGEATESLMPPSSRRRYAKHRDAYTADSHPRPTGSGLELCARRRDGTEFPVEISLSPIETEEGTLISNAIRDLSERRQAEEARAQLAAIVESSRDAIISKRLDGTILTWNSGAEQMYGYSREVIGRSISLLVPAGQRDDVPEILGRLSRGEAIEAYETVRRTKSGRLVAVSISAAPIRDSTGRITGGSVVAHDITEKKRAEQALLDANEDLQAFTYSASHDLRAPLRGLRGLSQALLEDYAGVLDEAGRECLRRLSAAATHMDALLLKLLGYSRIGRADVELCQVELDQVLKEALQQLEPEIRASDAWVSVPGNLPPVLAEATALAQVLGNLLSNAIKFVDAGVRPEVTIAVEERSEWLRLWVIDNGIGVDAGHHERIFGSFERLHDADRYSGTGLGLAIVRRGVARMNGRVGVESEIGRGSRFWIELRRANG